MLDVRTGGSWHATVVSSEGEEIALTGRYDEVSEPGRLVMTVPGDVVTAITPTSAPNDTTLPRRGQPNASAKWTFAATVCNLFKAISTGHLTQPSLAALAS